jgi:hypothetical protein
MSSIPQRMFPSFSCALGILLVWILSSVVRLLAATGDFFCFVDTNEYVFSGKIESQNSRGQLLLEL